MTLSEYAEEDYLQLSGIQHFAFCRRQWALIHIEEQWAENLRTVEGEILHERAHDPRRTEKRKELILSRAVPVCSRTLGVRGECDVVEFRQDENGVPLFGREGNYLPAPVEYKRGEPKESDADLLQLTAQAICLEEMFVCSVPEGYLFYGEIGRRIRVQIDGELRERAASAFREMHELYDRRHTPKVKTGKHCRACSLADLCLPKLCRERSAVSYLRRCLNEEEA